MSKQRKATNAGRSRLIGAVVSSEREANALPDRTVLIDQWERVYQLDEVWVRTGHAQRLAHEPGTEMSGYTSSIDYPATVIWAPGETPITEEKP